MLWFMLSILTAFFDALKNVFSKKILKDIDEYIVAWTSRFFSLFFLIPILFFTEIPMLGSQFLIALFFAGISVVITTILFMKAIKLSDLSITIPMISFTPLFLLLTSPLMLGEFPSFFGLIGVLLIVIGSYVLNIKEMKKGFLAPFKELLKERGPKLMLVVAFIWAIGSNFDKIGVQNSSPIFWSIAINIFAALALFPIMLYKSQKNIKQIPINLKVLIPIGLFVALLTITQMTAVSLALVAYVISIKRTSVIMSILLGYFVFKEKGIKERLIGALIMIIGVLFITLI